MSKIIKITQKYLDECEEEFRKKLSSVRLMGGKIDFSKKFEESDEKAVIYFTELAWIRKIFLLLAED